MGMIKNSKNREKQRIRVSKLHERVSNQGYQWMDIRQCRQLKKIHLSKSVNFDLFLLLLLIFKSIFVGTILE